ncbi:hypothetical protein SFRURICE_004958 [Spodoptera frugiperda]|uniref:Apoptosis regulatory protein Siva n=1 Tax=Spodoptera frugiperda TaxID=7108 RepID=A0A2H1VTR3_SPOFR|nr:apoptosis regulatory protein Siva [Spodoptera frugiperda]KAF9795586.1 hypothetical protein SFRURICE_004958 [Spodoptera frugiperda]
MAKRTNPFVEDFVPQSKVHIGMKQFNNNHDRLKQVYEKTLLLLFKGAKKCCPQEVTHSEHAALTTTDKQDKMKQLFIGKDGTLLHSGKMVDNKLQLKQCACGCTVESQCAYCEVSLCCGCQHICVHCERSHCVHCIMIGLEGAEICVSCYS